MENKIFRLVDMKHVCTLGREISIVFDYFGGFCMGAGLVDHR